MLASPSMYEGMQRTEQDHASGTPVTMHNILWKRYRDGPRDTSLKIGICICATTHIHMYIQCTYT